MSRHFPGAYPLVFRILGLITFGLLVTFWVGFRPDQATADEHAHRPSWSDVYIKPTPAPSAVGNLATEPADG